MQTSLRRFPFYTDDGKWSKISSTQCRLQARKQNLEISSRWFHSPLSVFPSTSINDQENFSISSLILEGKKKTKIPIQSRLREQQKSTRRKKNCQVNKIRDDNCSYSGKLALINELLVHFHEFFSQFLINIRCFRFSKVQTSSHFEKILEDLLLLSAVTALMCCLSLFFF